MKILVAGSNGFVGQHLCEYLIAAGHDVKGLSRRPSKAYELEWDGKTEDLWVRHLEDADALINLAGKSVNCRYTAANKEAILSSRIDSTTLLGELVQNLEQPLVWLNASTSTIYQDTRGDLPANTEAKGIIGDDFSVGVAKAWEECFFSFANPKVRQVAMRMAIVLGRDGGAFEVMHKLAGKGLASKQGPGDQWISWIHIQDVCRAMEYLIQNELSGPVNLCVPNPVQNETFNQKLKEKVKPPFVLPQPTWLLKLGAKMMGTETELILKSRKAYPEKLLDAGFGFSFPDIDSAFKEMMPE